MDEQVRQRAAAEGRSAAAVIREALDSYLARAATTPRGNDPIRAMAGSLRGLPVDAAADHDRALYGQRAMSGLRPRG
ncbi:MAG: ribbon-helix-helix protein, CopG family [Acidimicrobiales bacterium]